MNRSTRFPWPGLLALALAACGGGGGGDEGLSNDTAQGYAADAQAVPVQAATLLDNAATALEAALGESAPLAAEGRAQALRAVPAVAGFSFTVGCAGGGTVSFNISGGTVASRSNSQLDAGEVYELSFAACTSATGGAVLDGSLVLSVTAWSPSAADFSHTATALRLSTTQASYRLDGSVRNQRSTVPTAAGGKTITSQLSSAGVQLLSTVGTRQSSYELKALDWTVVRTLSASGALQARTHQGTLTLAASTPRRPNATLQVATQGALTVGSDGLVAAGRFSLTTGSDRLVVTYDSSAVTLELDLGNDGSVDRRWTVSRAAFDASAG